MRALLLSDQVDPAWSKRAAERMAGLRAEHAFLRELGPAPVVEGMREITWWTFAGGRANSLLARMIEAELGGKCQVRNASITCKENAGESVVAVRGIVRRWARAGGPSRMDATRLAPEHGRVSKFEPCLPAPLLAELVGGAVFDEVAAASAVAQSAGNG